MKTVAILYAQGLSVPYGIPATNEDAYAEFAWWSDKLMLHCNDSFWIVPGTGLED